MEYPCTTRDLTGVESLDPEKKLPVDGAALVMSPALLTKYLDAAKEITSHAVKDKVHVHGLHAMILRLMASITNASPTAMEAATTT